MDPTVKKDIISVLEEAIQIIKEGNIYRLKELSNHTIHNASIFQDDDSISVAVIIYSLSKVLERAKPNTANIIKHMHQAIDFLQKDDYQSFKAISKEMFKFISHVDTKLKLYIEEVVKQAEIKKGTKLYDHGISMGQAASILGISQWELMNYVGKTRIYDESREGSDILKKIKFTRGLFQ